MIPKMKDYSQDGFAGPFSWETKSLQEMVLPPTPVGERKLSALHQKNINDNNNNNNNFTFNNNKSNSNNNNKKNNNRKNSVVTMTAADNVENNNQNNNKNSQHRTYETIEELRTRLIKNYREAKKQREKYLDVSDNKANKTPEISINGYRSKRAQQQIFKNYKLQQDQDDASKERTTTAVSFALDLNDGEGQQHRGFSVSSRPSISFAEELNSAVQRQSALNSTSSANNVSSSSKSDSDSTTSSTPPTARISGGDVFFQNGVVIKKDSAEGTSNSRRGTFENTNGTRQQQQQQQQQQQKVDVISPSSKKEMGSPYKEIASPKQEMGSPNKEGNISRKNSMKNRLKRSDSKTEKNGEKRKNSLMKKSVEKSEVITQEDVDNVVENQHSKRDSLYQSAADDGGLNNVLDMLSNW